MILLLEDHYGVMCDFCGNNLHDKDLGGDLVTETPDEAELLAQHFDWFSEKNKHYCTSCVPSVQKIEVPRMTRWARMVFPSCTTELSIATMLTLGVILFAIATVNLLLILMGSLAYGLILRYHTVLHQRNELAMALLTVLEGGEEE